MSDALSFEVRAQDGRAIGFRWSPADGLDALDRRVRAAAEAVLS